MSSSLIFTPLPKRNARFDEAESTLRHRLGTQPKSPFAQPALGRVLLEEGKMAQAREYFQNARDAGPSLTKAQLGIACSSMIDGKYTFRLAELASVERSGPQSATAHRMSAGAFARTSHPQSALVEIESVPKPGPNDAAALTMKQTLSNEVR
jgi:predicted Zn-dependent protease